jgi:hypothetical protein
MEIFFFFKAWENIWGDPVSNQQKLKRKRRKKLSGLFSQSLVTILYFHQQCIKIAVVPYSHPHWRCHS